MLQLLREFRTNPSKILAKLEKDGRIVTRGELLQQLRKRLSLEEFGKFLFSIPDANYPRLSRLLPSMVAPQVQLNWTGQKDQQLLAASLRFVQSVDRHYADYMKRDLRDETILDYGCGYGRLARLMYYFTSPANFYGVDPWDESIKLCHEHGLTEHFLQSEYLPEALPVPFNNFRLIYAFSVFTHLSRRATLAALAAIRRHIADDGMLVITIRPLEYWDTDRTPEELRPALKLAHEIEGFAFNPHVHEPVDGDVTYGDTSLTLDWLAANAPAWAVLGQDWAPEDPVQTLIFLRPKAI